MQTEECVFVWCNPESAMLSSPSGTSIAAPSLFEGDNSSGEGCNEAPLLNSSVNARSTPGSAEGIVDSTALPPIQTLCPPPLVYAFVLVSLFGIGFLLHLSAAEQCEPPTHLTFVAVHQSLKSLMFKLTLMFPIGFHLTVPPKIFSFCRLLWGQCLEMA
jgi:hypothetical protein